MYGRKSEVNLITHTLAVAGGPLALPETGSVYEKHTVEANDGKQEFQLDLPVNVPVNAFWVSTALFGSGLFFHFFCFHPQITT